MAGRALLRTSLRIRRRRRRHEKSSDTMGMKHRVDHGVHIVFDAMSPQFAKRTGFSDDDTEKIKTVFQNRIDQTLRGRRIIRLPRRQRGSDETHLVGT